MPSNRPIRQKLRLPVAFVPSRLARRSARSALQQKKSRSPVQRSTRHAYVPSCQHPGRRGSGSHPPPVGTSLAGKESRENEALFCSRLLRQWAAAEGAGILTEILRGTFCRHAIRAAKAHIPGAVRYVWEGPALRTCRFYWPISVFPTARRSKTAIPTSMVTWTWPIWRICWRISVKPVRKNAEPAPRAGAGACFARIAETLHSRIHTLETTLENNEAVELVHGLVDACRSITAPPIPRKRPCPR